MDFTAGDIMVDAHFARFGSKSYAIDQINTVDVREHKAGGGAWFFLGALAFIFAALALSNLRDGMGPGVLFCALMAGLFGLLCVGSWKKSNRMFYRLFLATSNGDAQAMQSENRDDVMQLRSAIEQAMAARRR